MKFTYLLFVLIVMFTLSTKSFALEIYGLYPYVIDNKGKIQVKDTKFVNIKTNKNGERVHTYSEERGDLKKLSVVRESKNNAGKFDITIRNADIRENKEGGITARKDKLRKLHYENGKLHSVTKCEGSVKKPHTNEKVLIDQKAFHCRTATPLICEKIKKINLDGALTADFRKCSSFLDKVNTMNAAYHRAMNIDAKRIKNNEEELFGQLKQTYTANPRFEPTPMKAKLHNLNEVSRTISNINLLQEDCDFYALPKPLAKEIDSYNREGTISSPKP